VMSSKGERVKMFVCVPAGARRSLGRLAGGSHPAGGIRPAVGSYTVELR
jgi:hypothetical protein